MRNHARTALHLAVSLLALLLILSPEARPVGRFVLMPLYLVVATKAFMEGWRSGHLRKTFRELARDPPRNDPLESWALILGSIAGVMSA